MNKFVVWIDVNTGTFGLVSNDFKVVEVSEYELDLMCDGHLSDSDISMIGSTRPNLFVDPGPKEDA